MRSLSVSVSLSSYCPTFFTTGPPSRADTRRHAHLDVPENPYMHEDRSKEAAESRRGFTYLMGAGTGIVAAASVSGFCPQLCGA